MTTLFIPDFTPVQFVTLFLFGTHNDQQILDAIDLILGGIYVDSDETVAQEVFEEFALYELND